MEESDHERFHNHTILDVMRQMERSVIISQAVEVQDRILRCDLLHVGTGSWDVVANSFEASNVIHDPKCNKGPKCNNFWPSM